MRILVSIALFAILLQSRAQIDLINTGTTANLYPLAVINNTIVINGTHNYLTKSFDNCDNLLPVTLPVSASYFNLISMPSANSLYMLSSLGVTTNRQVYKSTDGGNNWIKKLDVNGVNMIALKFFDTLEGISTDKYKIHRTTDGGNTWTVNASPYINSTALEVFDSLVCLGGGLGSMAFSKDRGYTWKPAASFDHGTFADFFFLNKDTIFGVGLRGWSGEAFVKSTNGGNNWSVGTLPMNYATWAIHFRKTNEGYIVGYDTDDSLGLILKTTNLGQSWSWFKTTFKADLRDIVFLNDSLALVSGTNGTLFTWKYKQSLFTGLTEKDFENSGIKTFPNPVKDKLTIELTNPNMQKIDLELLNSLGQIIYKGFYTGQRQEIDLNSIPSGLYFLHVTNGSKQSVLKIIKE